jgi:hypothetical protein
MSNIQFFERRKHWIDHMHKVHTPLWLRYLQRPLAWRCLECRLTSRGEFTNEEKMQTSFVKHIEQDHPDLQKRQWQHLVDHCGVPQLRSSGICPICSSTGHPRVIPPQLGPQSEVTEGSTRAKAQDSEAQVVKDASESRHKRKVRFDTLESSDDESRTRSAEISSSNPSSWHLTRATDDRGVENCMAEHLRALAFNFTTRLMDDDKRNSDTSSGRSSDSVQLGLEDLSEVGLEDDPPPLPSGKCDEIDDALYIKDKEKVEMKNCIAQNLRILRGESDEHIDWKFNWLNGKRDIKPDIASTEERERFSYRLPEKDTIWSGMDSKYVPAYVACLFMIVGLFKKALLSSERGSDNNKPSAQEYLGNAGAFFKVQQVVFSRLLTKGTAPKSRYVSVRDVSLTMPLSFDHYLLIHLR